MIKKGDLLMKAPGCRRKGIRQKEVYVAARDGDPISRWERGRGYVLTDDYWIYLEGNWNYYTSKDLVPATEVDPSKLTTKGMRLEDVLKRYERLAENGQIVTKNGKKKAKSAV